MNAQITTFNKCIDINGYGQSISSINLLPDGNYIIYSGALSQSFIQGLGIVLINSNGNLVDSKYYLDSTKIFYAGLYGSCVATSDGNFVHGSHTKIISEENSDFLIGKFNAMGDTLWQTILGTEESDRGFRAIEAQDGGYVRTQ